MRKQWAMQWVVNGHRKDKRTGAVSPVKGSKYFEELSNKGAGWDERSTKNNVR